jgi:hypothetical protein
MFFKRKNPWKLYSKKLIFADQKLPELLHQELHGNFIHQLQHTERVMAHLFANRDKLELLTDKMHLARQEIENYENQMKLMRSQKDIHKKSIAELKLKKQQHVLAQKQLRKTAQALGGDLTDIEGLAHTQIHRLQNEARLLQNRIPLLRDHFIRNQRITTKKHVKIFDRQYKQAQQIIKGLLKF